MIWIVIWVICGFITYSIASNKGLYSGSWFVIGFLFGPFGVLYALLAKADDNEIEAKKVSSGDLKKCPYCAELVKKEAIICRHCNSDLESPKSKIAETARTQEEGIVEPPAPKNLESLSTQVNKGDDLRAMIKAEKSKADSFRTLMYILLLVIVMIIIIYIGMQESQIKH